MPIPEEYAGVTFVYDVETDGYVGSELTGAPANGVRFILYAVNPVTGTPVEPLVEVGYADFTVTETASSGTVHVIVVSGGVTYRDYAVTAAGGVSSLTVTIDGYAAGAPFLADAELNEFYQRVRETEWMARYGYSRMDAAGSEGAAERLA